MRFQCPQCNEILELDDCTPGELVQCPKCSNPVNVPEPLAPGAILGDFVIINQLGSGGMGTVYRAHQLTLDRDIAIKVLNTPTDSPNAADETQAIIKEARLAASLNHPNIVQAYAISNENNLWYFAMEYVNGRTLHDILKEDGPISIRQCLSIGSEIINALRHAWNEKRLIHLDIKPENIMINSSNHAKLADLGLARYAVDTSSSGETELMGTPQYIAPELLLNAAPDARCDIYSLGATLYQILTGRLPYYDKSPEELVKKHLFEPLTPLRQINPDIPGGLARIIENMLAKRPCHRYQDYDELFTDFELLKQGKTPVKELPLTAQVPIDINLSDPLAPPPPPTKNTIPHPSPTDHSITTGRTVSGKVIRFTNSGTSPAPVIAPTHTLHVSQTPKPAVTPAPATAPRKNRVPILIISLAILVIAIAGITVAVLSSSPKAESDTTPPPEPEVADTTPATESDVASTVSTADSPETPKADKAPDYTRLKLLVAQSSTTGYDVAKEILADHPEETATVYEVLAPLSEAKLAEARLPLFQDMDNKFFDKQKEIRAEEHRQEEEAQHKRDEEERRKREAAEAEKRQKEAERRIQEIVTEKKEKLEKLHEFFAEHKDLRAQMLFQERLKGEDEVLGTWRTNWLQLINKAHQCYDSYLMDLPSLAHKETILVPVRIFYKEKKEATPEEFYSFCKTKLVNCDDDIITLECDNFTFVTNLPLLQQKKYTKYQKNTTTLKVPIQMLFPEQLFAILESIVSIRKEEVSHDDIAEMVAAWYLVHGNNITMLRDHPLFESIWQSKEYLPEVDKELELLQNETLGKNYLSYLTTLMDAYAKEPQTVLARIHDTCLIKYFEVLPASFPTLKKDFEELYRKRFLPLFKQYH